MIKVLFKNQKGIASMFTGILIFIIGIMFMGIMIAFIVGYFNSLEDMQIYKNNKNTLTIINNILIDLKTAETGSYKKINIEPTNVITFDNINNVVIIEQEIRNQRFYEKQKEYINFGNLNISKKENMIVFTLNLETNIKLNNFVEILPAKQEISFEVFLKENDVTNINVERTN
ncbi:MAG: hypothetical protein WCY27_02860 [archaeon]|jgi:hypothetical protein|nr:hypothetical protein [archaeon]MDD2477516.1 hypothetical protein [Candidatus ainarchaeum sp.]MDD3084815.1 hypothetical protein [Candidatus ainarchaeum sp.]MDD4221379.1 hypothetical protein [Candidatus ainarchaeum sp.]MDD4662381.1 hypothetical protein [Candidatus ainarchaeum sp.]